jgi:hypothetical protein
MSWREAARTAGFQPYRPVEPTPDYVYLGGFGFSGDAASHLGICATLGDGEVTVDTELAEHRMIASIELRRQVADALLHYVHRHEEELSLPLDVRVEPRDRTIRVDGVEQTFHGAQVAGSTRWSGSCVVGGRHITVTTTGLATVDAIETTDASDLSDSPPPAP